MDSSFGDMCRERERAREREQEKARQRQRQRQTETETGRNRDKSTHIRRGRADSLVIELANQERERARERERERQTHTSGEGVPPASSYGLSTKRTVSPDSLHNSSRATALTINLPYETGATELSPGPLTPATTSSSLASPLCSAFAPTPSPIFPSVWGALVVCACACVGRRVPRIRVFPCAR